MCVLFAAEVLLVYICPCTPSSKSPQALQSNSELMSNNTTANNTHLQVDSTQPQDLVSSWQRPLGQNVLLVSIINSCVVAHQFAIGISLMQLRASTTSRHLMIYSLVRTHKHTTSIHAALIRHFTGLSYSRVCQPFVTTDEFTYVRTPHTWSKHFHMTRLPRRWQVTASIRWTEIQDNMYTVGWDGEARGGRMNMYVCMYIKWVMVGIGNTIEWWR